MTTSLYDRPVNRGDDYYERTKHYDYDSEGEEEERKRRRLNRKLDRDMLRTRVPVTVTVEHWYGNSFSLITNSSDPIHYLIK